MTPAMREVTVTTGQGKFGQSVKVGPHTLVSDEAQADGGDDTGPAPHDFLLVALGTCTSSTVKLYADRKGWPLRRVEVTLSQQKAEGAHAIVRRIRLEGDLTEEQRARLLEIAGKCPVHKTLTGTIHVTSELLGLDGAGPQS
jgi:putative redox protein